MQFSTRAGAFPADFQKSMEGKLIKAALTATDEAALGAQGQIRTVMRGAKLGGLANAIKQTSDKKKKRILGAPGQRWRVSGVVYAHIRSDRTAGALEAYTQGATIIPNKGRWLAIATDQIPKFAGRYRMTPKLYVDGGFEQKIGKLVFIQSRKGNVAYLIAKEVGINPLKAGSARSLRGGRPRSGDVSASIIAFVLIRQTRRDARLDPNEIANQWRDKLPALMQDAYLSQNPL